MLERCRKYRVALGVRAIVPGTTQASMLANCTEVAWGVLSVRSDDLTAVVARAYRRCQPRPYVCLTLASHHHGFGYAYFDAAPSGAAGLVVGGHTPLQFDPPMPITPEPHSAVQVGVCGLVVVRYTLRSIMLQVHEDAKRGGPVSARPGWEFPSGELMGLHESASPKGFDVLSLAEFNAEDN